MSEPGTAQMTNVSLFHRPCVSLSPGEAETPDLSVVVPSVNGWGDLRVCLEALNTQRKEVKLEVLVVDRLGEGLREQVRHAFPWVRLIPASTSTVIPDLRAMGVGEARAPAVAVIEDHILVPPGWARRMLAALDAGADVVGGPIENAATETLVEWAAFLCEYSACLPPLPAGPADWLPGNNIVYRRELLERFRPVLESGRWESHLHDSLRQAGTTLVCRPEVAVGHKKHFTIGEYVGQRYLYSRSYAGMRVAGAPLLLRAAYGLAALLLPPVLFYRTVARVWPHRAYRGHLIRSLPLLGLFVVAWAAGEVVGYWAGPGDSLSRVR